MFVIFSEQQNINFNKIAKQTIQKKLRDVQQRAKGTSFCKLYQDWEGKKFWYQATDFKSQIASHR